MREQQRYISLQIRQEVEQRRKRELEQLEEELREEWERQQREKLQTLQRLYQESLQLLGEGHRSAKENVRCNVIGLKQEAIPCLHMLDF